MFTILLSTDRKLSIQSFLVYNAMQEQQDERFICFVRIPMVFSYGGHTNCIRLANCIQYTVLMRLGREELKVCTTHLP